ncbi:NUDIX hydrolase [Patescibacteria group bacterium]|nr:NUDIX hydrolase [Patescibacteria group bacterium]
MKKGVNVIITDDKNRVLVLKRSSHAKSSPNLWNLLGGNVGNSETLKEAVKREAREETNLEVESHNDYFFIYYYPHGTKENAHTAVYAFKVKLISRRIRLDKTHTEFKWVSRDNWQSLDYTPSGAATLREFFK